MMASNNMVSVDGFFMNLTNLDKVLWPQDHLTKADLIMYYTNIADLIIPYLRDRPLVLTRYPNGINGNWFYQKDAPDHLPEWINTFSYRDGVRVIRYIMVNKKADLIWLANQACIEIHPWLSRIEELEQPDYLVLDLDPSPLNSFSDVVKIAQVIKLLLDELGLEGFPKTSGGDGLHIYVPVVNRYPYGTIRNLGQILASLVCQILPQLATTERSVRHRGNRVYVDYLQNVKGKTLCAPYSVRPRKGAPVSAPLLWEELPYVNPDLFNIHTIWSRIEQSGDLFHKVLTLKQDLSLAFNRLSINV